MHRLRADYFVDYTKEDFASRGQTYDVIFDMVPEILQADNPAYEQDRDVHVIGTREGSSWRSLS